MRRTCQYTGGCDREATKAFPADPVNGWLCEEHFREVLNAAADLQRADWRKENEEWQAHFAEYRRKHNLDVAKLTDDQEREIGDEVRRWKKARRGSNQPPK
jgi:hypothetical protein